jgi:hypothetical protein
VQLVRHSRVRVRLTLPMKTGTAQHRSALCGLEGNSGRGFTCRTRDLSLPMNFDALVPLGLAYLAVLWVVHELLLVEEKLLSRRENELGVTVNALQNPVRKFHGLLSAASEFPRAAFGSRFIFARIGVSA